VAALLPVLAPLYDEDALSESGWYSGRLISLVEEEDGKDAA
jgi:hypothetical protein